MIAEVQLWGRTIGAGGKNIAFLMNPAGAWELAPAFDVTYSYNPEGAWTGRHQMTLQGKSDGFELDDFIACAEVAQMKRGRAKAIVGEVTEAVADWATFAEEAGVPVSWAAAIQKHHRLEICG